MFILVLYQHIDSGAKVATEALLAELQKQQYEHTYVIYRQDFYHYKGKFSFVRNLVWSILDFRSQINAQPQMNIMYTTVFTAIIAQFISNKRSSPSIFHLHGDHRFGKLKELKHPLFFLQAWYAKILGRAILFLQTLAIQKSARTIFVSKFAQDEFVHRYNLTEHSHQFSVIYNGVSLQKYRSISESQKQQLKQKYHLRHKHLITYIGRIDEKKGIHCLVDALEWLPRKDVSLLIIYPETKDGHSHKYLNLLKQKAKHAQHDIQFVENPRFLEHFYQVSDCVVLPSEQEMFPLVMLEALASGTPCLCTNVGGVSEALRSLPRLLLSSVEPVYLSKRIAAILDLPPSGKRELQQKEVKLAQKYSWAKAAEQLEQLFIATQY